MYSTHPRHALVSGVGEGASATAGGSHAGQQSIRTCNHVSEYVYATATSSRGDNQQKHPKFRPPPPKNWN
eukprot:5363333-Amphidinium_carterae.2